jgi:hypothetical protein
MSVSAAGNTSEISSDHKLAIEGWKARKEQLFKQQKSVLEINDEAEKMKPLSLRRPKKTA